VPLSVAFPLDHTEQMTITRLVPLAMAAFIVVFAIRVFATGITRS